MSSILIAILVIAFKGSIDSSKNAHATSVMLFKRSTRFEQFSSTFDGTLLVGCIDISLCDYKRRGDLPWCVCVVIQANLDRDILLSSHHDSELKQSQQAITARINRICKAIFVGRVSSLGQHELMYQVDDGKAIEAALGKLSETSGAYFTVKSEYDPEWRRAGFYLESLRPGLLLLD